MLDPKGNYTLIHEPNEGNKSKNILNRLCRSLNKSITNIYVFLQQNFRWQLLKVNSFRSTSLIVILIILLIFTFYRYFYIDYNSQVTRIMSGEETSSNFFKKV